MGKKQKQTEAFTLEGRFLGFEIEDGYKIKRLRLMTAAGECDIKLTKEARASLGRVPLPGDWLQVWGEQTTHRETEVTKLKAYKMSVVAPRQTGMEPTSTPPKATAALPATSILICQKSDCMKRGSQAVCTALETALGDRGLADQVTLRTTGCMKNCKAGSNLVLMPSKIRYSQITPSDIPSLMDKHFPAPTETEAGALECVPASV